MGLHSLYNYFRGEARAELEGISPERVLNRCRDAGIELWRLEPVSPCCLRFSLPAAGYRRLRPIVRRSGCRVRLISRRGLLYSSRRTARHLPLVAGLLLFIGLMFYLNSIILTIDVTGCEKLRPAEVLAAMEREGVGVGTFTRSVDASDLRNFILLDIPELVWFTVNFHGSRASVDVRERIPMPEKLSLRGAADIYADYSGVITELRVYYGEAVVKEHTVVHEGDLLVSGSVYLKNAEKTLPVHALADIKARVWHKSTAVLPLRWNTKVPTGRTKTKIALILGKKRINFYQNGGKAFDNCDRITKRYMLDELTGLPLPVGLIIYEDAEYESYSQLLEPESQSAPLSAVIKERLRREEEAQILSQRAYTEGEYLYVRVTGESHRDIGVTVLR